MYCLFHTVYLQYVLTSIFSIYFNLFCGMFTLVQLQRKGLSKSINKIVSHFNVLFGKPSLFQAVFIYFKLLQQFIFTSLFILISFVVSSVFFSSEVVILQKESCLSSLVFFMAVSGSNKSF